MLFYKKKSFRKAYETFSKWYDSSILITDGANPINPIPHFFSLCSKLTFLQFHTLFINIETAEVWI